IHAAGASPEGVRKLDGIVQGRVSERPDRPRTIDMLTTTQLDLALGRSNVVHAALLAGAASTAFLTRCGGLERFRNDDPALHGQAAWTSLGMPFAAFTNPARGVRAEVRPPGKAWRVHGRAGPSQLPPPRGGPVRNKTGDDGILEGAPRDGRVGGPDQGLVAQARR